MICIVFTCRDLPNDEADKLTNGMDEWIDDMKNNETTTTSNGVTEKELPPIRTNANAVQNKGSMVLVVISYLLLGPKHIILANSVNFKLHGY